MPNRDDVELLLFANRLLERMLHIDVHYDKAELCVIYTIQIHIDCPTCEKGEIKIEHVTDTGEKIKEEIETCPTCKGSGRLTMNSRQRVSEFALYDFIQRYHASKAKIKEQINWNSAEEVHAMLSKKPPF